MSHVRKPVEYARHRRVQAKPFVERTIPTKRHEDGQEYWRHDLDAMRKWLAVVVISLHAGYPIGNGGVIKFLGWSSFIRHSLAINFVIHITHSWIMPLFFWISGWLAAQSLESRCKAPANFVWDRTLRLGLPSLLYTLFVQPFTMLFTLQEWSMGSISDYFVGYWKGLSGVTGVAWYAATLLCIDIGAAFIKRVTGTKRSISSTPASPSSPFDILDKFSWILLAAGGFLTRQVFPGRQICMPLGFRPGFLPQHLYFYWLGYVSFRQDSRTLKCPGGKVIKFLARSPTMALLVSSALYCLVLVPGIQQILRSRDYTGTLMTAARDLPSAIISYMDWLRDDAAWKLDSVFYAVWREFSALVLVGPAITSYFDQVFSKPQTTHRNGFAPRFWHHRYSYAAYLIHLPITTWTCYVLEALVVAAVPLPIQQAVADRVAVNEVVCLCLTLAISWISVSISFALGLILVERFPWAAKII